MGHDDPRWSQAVASGLAGQDFAAVFRRTRRPTRSIKAAKADLKKLVPDDAREAIGHCLRANRSKSGAVTFDLLDREKSQNSLKYPIGNCGHVTSSLLGTPEPHSRADSFLRRSSQKLINRTAPEIASAFFLNQSGLFKIPLV
jgi:hypothetical protein